MPAAFVLPVVSIFYAYLIAGILLLPWWHWRGLRQLDQTAAQGPWGFRLLISPGLVTLWPVLVLRAQKAQGHPLPENNAHRAVARAAEPTEKAGAA